MNIRFLIMIILATFSSALNADTPKPLGNGSLIPGIARNEDDKAVTYSEIFDYGEIRELKATYSKQSGDYQAIEYGYNGIEEQLDNAKDFFVILENEYNLREENKQKNY